MGLWGSFMDALFLVVAELLIVPLILWALIALELTVGVLASVVSVLLGRRSASEAVAYRWRAVRRRLLWSLIFLTSGLLLADLVFFDRLVTLALASVDERDDLDVEFAHAEGSFILGRIELQHLTLGGVQGGDDPTARFAVNIESLVIDIDTARLLTAEFAVEEIAVDGVEGSFERVRVREREREPERKGIDLSREFSVQRLHVGDMQLALRDHTREPAREFGLHLGELDMGPLHSDSALFDLLYRARGHGTVEGHAFVLTAIEHGDTAQSTLEIQVPLDTFDEQLEKAAGVRAKGHADLTIVNAYSGGPPEPKIDLSVGMRLRGLELEAGGADVDFRTKLMLQMAERALAQLGDEFPLEFEISLLRSELQGMRSIAEAGLPERVADGIATALRETMLEGEKR